MGAMMAIIVAGTPNKAAGRRKTVNKLMNVEMD